ncbi:MAG: DUF167 domain-containing protein [Micromonosporaceae bacterium]|nr:DUF167 domain-containing protein [Micromonosporaceae bacterium]
MPSPRERPPEAVTVPVRVRPDASRVKVGGRYDGPHGPALVVAVTAPPVDGRATDMALRAVAKALGVRASAVTLRVGAASRDKVLTVTGPSTELAERVAELLGGRA